MVASNFLVAQIRFMVHWTCFHGCLEKVLVACMCFPIPWWRFMVVGIHFLVAWTLLDDCLVKVSVCLDSLPGYLMLVPRLPGKCYCLLRCSSWCTGLGTMVAWWRLPVAWICFLLHLNWFRGCLEKVPGCMYLLSCSLVKVHGCLDSLPACLDFARLPGEGSWMSGFTSWIPCGFQGCLVNVTVCSDSAPGALDLIPWLLDEGSRLPGFGFWCSEIGSIIAWWRFLVAWIHFLVAWIWFLVSLIWCSMVSFLAAWIFFLVPSTWFHGSLDFLSWLPGEGSCLPQFGSWLLVHVSMMSWWRFVVALVHSLVPWSWFS